MMYLSFFTGTNKNKKQKLLKLEDENLTSLFPWIERESSTSPLNTHHPHQISTNHSIPQVRFVLEKGDTKRAHLYFFFFL